ncbi:GGDEF domain-containing protein [Vogesella fluminis]|uniref:diguanylate cyclase n=1 Tax=Vogesella fluminis TaxID=1069161 RepID=A0ABQ3H7Q1_9NEIS|nr:diguanylate cyclase [Vogesella fluminis]GHD74799.1 GGDEF domain-containing protein [Vogesella fluminis]
MTIFQSSTWVKLLGLLPGELNPNEAGWLALPQHHMPLMSNRRAQMIMNRVRLFASLFAVLTPLWMFVDLLALPNPLAWQLSLLRLGATGCFVFILYYRMEVTLFNAWRGMAMLFAIPTLFYVISYLLLARYHLSGVSAAVGTGYAFLPFVLLAGLAIFPLTLLESAAFAAPILIAHVIAGYFQFPVVDWPSFWGAFWLQGLIAGVAALAGVCQLAFMIALVQQAVRDPLTGAFSRRSGEEVLELQFILAGRSGSPFSVAFIDIDHFKAVNDQYGHQQGDVLLKQFAQTLTQGLRKGDVLVRWGGEEFLLLLPNIDCQQAMHALQRLRRNGFGLRPDRTPLTASIGVADMLEEGCNDWRRLVEIADQRMYVAKQQGRNRVIATAGNEPPVSQPVLA